MKTKNATNIKLIKIIVIQFVISGGITKIRR